MPAVGFSAQEAVDGGRIANDRFYQAARARIAEKLIRGPAAAFDQATARLERQPQAVFAGCDPSATDAQDADPPNRNAGA